MTPSFALKSKTGVRRLSIVVGPRRQLRVLGEKALPRACRSHSQRCLVTVVATTRRTRSALWRRTPPVALARRRTGSPRNSGSSASSSTTSGPAGREAPAIIATDHRRGVRCPREIAERFAQLLPSNWDDQRPDEFLWEAAARRSNVPGFDVRVIATPGLAFLICEQWVVEAAAGWVVRAWLAEDGPLYASAVDLEALGEEDDLDEDAPG